MAPTFLQVCFFSGVSIPLRRTFMPLIAMVSPSTTKAVPEMSTLTTPLGGNRRMIGEGLIPRQMTCWSQPGWGYSPPLVMLQSAGFGLLAGSTMRCTNVSATIAIAPRIRNGNSFFKNLGTVMLQQSNEKYDVSNSEQNLNCSKRQSPFHKAGKR